MYFNILHKEKLNRTFNGSGINLKILFWSKCVHLTLIMLLIWCQGNFVLIIACATWAEFILMCAFLCNSITMATLHSSNKGSKCDAMILYFAR